jgi:hypothetical protein
MGCQANAVSSLASEGNSGTDGAFLSPLRRWFVPPLAHGLRRGLHSYAASRLGLMLSSHLTATPSADKLPSAPAHCPGSVASQSCSVRIHRRRETRGQTERFFPFAELGPFPAFSHGLRRFAAKSRRPRSHHRNSFSGQIGTRAGRVRH